MPDVSLGSANLVGGFPLEVIASDDGTVELWEREACFGFTLSADGVNQLREMLDRAAMPGQDGAQLVNSVQERHPGDEVGLVHEDEAHPQ